MIFVLMGKSLSGKTYLQNKLSESGIKSLITSTTRPKRSKQDADYHFVTDAQFNLDKYMHQALAVRKYKVATGDTWYYYLNTNDLNADTDGCLVLDYQGFKDLSEEIEADLIGIYLDISIKERIKRHYDFRANENEREFVRRLYDDEFNAFNGIESDDRVKSFMSAQDAFDFVMKKAGVQN